MTEARRGERLLIVVRHLTGLRRYMRVLPLLEAQGIDIAVRYRYASNTDEAVERDLASSVPGLRAALLPKSRERTSERLALRLRELEDLLRYEHPDYAGCTALRVRARRTVSPGVQRWGARIARLGPRAAAFVVGVAETADRLLPPAHWAETVLDEEQPDAVVVAPLVEWGSDQPDAVKAARARGLPTAVWIPSWDNLTNKGLLNVVPDRAVVWNAMQARELERYHSVPVDRVRVTGAQAFDAWLDSPAVEGRDEFCARHDFDPSLPFVLYLGSSRQIAPDEPFFFLHWLEHLRSSGDPVLTTVPVLVRPHPTPSIIRTWLASGAGRLPGVSLDPDDPDMSRWEEAFGPDYRAALTHCTVTVGINTSAFLEAAIFDKPACTVELPQTISGQTETLHYRHLVDPSYGFVRVARSLDEHAGDLRARLDDPTLDREERERFLGSFIWPRGMREPAAPHFATEVADFLRTGVPARPTAGARLAGRVLARSAWLVGAPLEEHPVLRFVAWCQVSALVARSYGRAAVRRAERMRARLRRA